MDGRTKPPARLRILLRQHSREPAKAADGRSGRERVDAAQAAAGAALALAGGALAGDDGSDGARGTGARARSSGAAGLDGDGRGGCCGVGVDVLDGRLLEGCAVCADGEVLEVGHGLVACCRGVDAEDHAFAAVDAVLLLAVEP